MAGPRQLWGAAGGFSGAAAGAWKPLQGQGEDQWVYVNSFAEEGRQGQMRRKVRHAAEGYVEVLAGLTVAGTGVCADASVQDESILMGAPQVNSCPKAATMPCLSCLMRSQGQAIYQATSRCSGCQVFGSARQAHRHTHLLELPGSLRSE